MKPLSMNLKKLAAKVINAESEYHEYFRGKMDKHDIDSPAELEDDEVHDFFDEVDDGWNGEDEGKTVTAIDFSSKEEMEEYKRNHVVRDGTKLEVKKPYSPKATPAKDDFHNQGPDDKMEHHKKAEKEHRDRSDHHMNEAKKHDSRRKQLEGWKQEAEGNGESKEEIDSLHKAIGDSRRKSMTSRRLSEEHESAANAHGEAHRAQESYWNGSDDSDKARKKPNAMSDKARERTKDLKESDKG